MNVYLHTQFTKILHLMSGALVVLVGWRGDDEDNNDDDDVVVE